MSDANTLPALEPPLLPPLAEPEKLDPQQLNARLREVQVLQTKRELEPSEIRESITLIQILRGTMSTAGPKSRPKAAPKKINSLEEFEASLGLKS